MTVSSGSEKSRPNDLMCHRERSRFFPERFSIATLLSGKTANESFAGSAVIIMRSDTAALSSTIESTAMYFPGYSKWCKTLCPSAIVPSPKFHEKRTFSTKSCSLLYARPRNSVSAPTITIRSSPPSAKRTGTGGGTYESWYVVPEVDVAVVCGVVVAVSVWSAVSPSTGSAVTERVPEPGVGTAAEKVDTLALERCKVLPSPAAPVSAEYEIESLSLSSLPQQRRISVSPLFESENALSK